jgi:hypothetical protein
MRRGIARACVSCKPLSHTPLTSRQWFIAAL